MKMNKFDNIVRKALGKKSTSPSFNTAKFFSTSWKKRGTKYDWDFDGVANKKDCQPFNTMRQDEFFHSTNKKNVPYIKKYGLISNKERVRRGMIKKDEDDIILDEVFVTTSFSSYRDKKTSAIIVFDIPKNKLKEFNYRQTYNPGDFALTHIPSKYIKKIIYL